MIQLKQILFPTDFSPCADQALTYALFFARQFRAELHMLHAILLHEEDPHNPEHHFPNIDEIHVRLKEMAGARMNAAIEDHKADDIQIKQVQQRSIAAAPQILDYAQENDIDLIVMGTHGRRGLKHLLLGSVVEEVVRMAVCPVLTIRQQKEVPSTLEIKHILIPVDFSDYAQCALTYAKRLAGIFHSHLQLLHVIEETALPAFYLTGTPSLLDLMPDIEARSKKELQELFSKTEGPEVVAGYHVVRGLAAREIHDYAESESADLIVIATHGLTGIEHLLLGSVTERVIRTAQCPVFTVKPFGKSLIQ